MRRKEIVIVLLLVAFGLLYHMFESGEFSLYEGCSFNSKALLEKKYFAYPEEEQRFSNIAAIEIYNRAGNVLIEKAAGDDTVIAPVIRVHHKKRKQADSIRKDIKLTYRKDNKKLSIGTGSKSNFPYRRVRIILKLQVPEGVELNITNRYGDIELNKTGSNTLLDGKHGNIFVNHIKNDIKIRHGYGKIIIRDIDGDIDLQTRYASLDIQHVAMARIQSEHSKIRMRDVRKGIQLSNSHQSIDVADIKGDVNISANHCSIRLKKAISDYVIIKNSYNETRLDDITANSLNLWTSHGKLILDFRHVEDTINVNGKYADIELRFPGSITPLFSINTTYGDINNRTPLEIEIFSGKVKKTVTSLDGSPEVIINNTYGDITLKNSR